jgi:hypothetical protein
MDHHNVEFYDNANNLSVIENSSESKFPKNEIGLIRG